MSNMINDNLYVTHSLGGLRKMQKTGEYPNTLKITSERYNHVWRIKVKEDNQKGILKIKRVVVYNYILGDVDFKVQGVVKGLPSSDWFVVDGVVTIMID